LEKYPTAGREVFRSILLHREAIKAYYRSFPKDRLDEGIGKGDSPRKELVHQIGNTRLRSQAFESSNLPNWRYYEVDPQAFEELNKMGLEQLLTQLDLSTETLYDKSVGAQFGDKQISLPYGNHCSEIANLAAVEGHDKLHLGFLVKFGDYFDTPRPDQMKQLYG
jgi:hypothetical protein